MAIKYYALNAEGRICVTANVPQPGEENPPAYDFPADFPFCRQLEYKIVDGVLVHEPPPEPEAAPTQEERIADLEEALELLLSGVTE